MMSDDQKLLPPAAVVENLLLRVRAALAGGDHPRVVNELRALLCLMPAVAGIWHDLAVTLGTLGLAPLMASRRAAWSDPGEPGRWHALALNSDLSEAVAATRRALVLDPGFGDAALVLAARIADGDLAAALKPAIWTTRLMPTVAIAWHNRGEIELRLGMSAAAEQSLRAALACDSNLAVSRYRLGVLAETRGAVDEAGAWYRTAMLAEARTQAPPAFVPSGARPLGLGLPLAGAYGWAVYGGALASRMIETGRGDPIALVPFPIGAKGPAVGDAELAVRARTRAALAAFKIGFDGAAPFPVLVGTGNDFVQTPVLAHGSTNHAIVALESTYLSAAGRARANRFDIMLPMSTWLADVLQGWGFARVVPIIQGVALERFRPRARAGHYPNRFVVFSGGKIEHRKGQDLVLAAFKAFQARHSDALLLTAWHSPWPKSASTIVWGGQVATAPTVGADDRLDIAGWLTKVGLPPSAFLDLGVLSHDDFAALLPEIDVAVFPNRCEGGTNLVAMECMAGGVPVILSDNTGHRDLIEPGNCLTLATQRRVVAPSAAGGTEGWGESDVDEILAQLEWAYAQRAALREVGMAGRRSIERFSWPAQMSLLLDAIGY